MELLSEYGLFLAKIVTVVLAIAAIAAIIVNVAQRNKRQRGELRVNNLSEQYKEMKEELAAALMDSHQQKQWPGYADTFQRLHEESACVLRSMPETLLHPYHSINHKIFSCLKRNIQLPQKDSKYPFPLNLVLP